MIHRISSSLESFKEIEFYPGLNILLAEKSPEATEKHTRNRVGKTSLIEIIHFLTGGNAKKESIFRTEPLKNHTFQMEFDLDNARVSVERTARNRNLSKVQFSLVSDNIGDHSWLPQLNLFEQSTISNHRWKNFLGAVMFSLTEDEEDESEKFGPTFRSIFGYFVRRQQSGGFISPFKYFEQQRTYLQQVNISYLLGLDWTIPQQWEVVRQREKGLKELRKAASEGTLGQTIGTTAELRTKLAVVESRYNELRERVSSFHVLAEYRDLEREAAEITLQMNDLSDQNTLDRELISELEQSLEMDVPPTPEDLNSLYQEVGVVLPQAVVRRFEDVRQFHESVVQNRRLYLNGELSSARRRIVQREEQMAKLDRRRSQILGILQSHGALDQLTELQAELARKEAEMEALRQRFSAAEQLEGRKAELEIERQKLRLRLIQDYQEQSNKINRAIVAFEEISNALYEDAGSLTIDPSLNGPDFGVQIHGSRSKGISNMQIFCFDMMLMRICKEREIGPDFLVHDSHLFDGVDERQVIRALQVGAETAQKLGFQYIVTLNSDQLPKEYPSDFDLNVYSLPIRLTDATQTGGLFGIRFN
jgi:uncharacterized protein YydD (DUF2326 family)